MMKQKPEVSVAVAVAKVAAAVGGMTEILTNDYALTVRADGFVSRQLVVAATGDDFWVGTKHFDSRSGKHYGETVMGKHFHPNDVDSAIAYAMTELAWVHSITADELRAKARGATTGDIQQPASEARYEAACVAVEEGREVAHAPRRFATLAEAEQYAKSTPVSKDGVRPWIRDTQSTKAIGSFLMVGGKPAQHSV